MSMCEDKENPPLKKERAVGDVPFSCGSFFEFGAVFYLFLYFIIY